MNNIKYKFISLLLKIQCGLFFESISSFFNIHNNYNKTLSNKLYKGNCDYWVNISFGVINPCKMPYKYIVESVCDTIGAGKSYMGKDWSIKEPFKWWLKRDCYSIFHPHTRVILFRIYRDIYFEGWNTVSRRLRNNFYKNIYENI